MPNFVVIRALAQILMLRANAQLVLGKNDEAMADIQVIHRLAAALQGHPTLVSAMIRVAVLGGPGLQTFWEGVTAHRWSDRQLQELQQLFAPINLVEDVDYALRAVELAGVNMLVERNTARPSAIFAFGSTTASHASFFTGARWKNAWLDLVPRGWIEQNRLVHNRLLVDALAATFPQPGQVSPAGCARSMSEMQKTLDHWTPFNQLARVAIPRIDKAIQTTVRCHSLVHLAQIVCSLEIYHRAVGHYPENLAAVVPQFLAQLPRDPITGVPFLYRRAEDDTFLLYSVGWNEKDNGGQVRLNNDPAPSDAGDWVWPLLPKGSVLRNGN
jgi:hypothetical protein